MIYKYLIEKIIHIMIIMEKVSNIYNVGLILIKKIRSKLEVIIMILLIWINIELQVIWEDQKEYKNGHKNK